jgi:hypothetical protein
MNPEALSGTTGAIFNTSEVLAALGDIATSSGSILFSTLSEFDI